MSSGYVTVSIPKTLVEKVDEAIDTGLTTYNSRAEFVKDAIRIRLRELGIIV